MCRYDIDIKIAVLPLVKAWLENSYGVEPFELSQDNQYGIFLFNCLTHVKKVDKIIPDLNINTDYYTDELKIRLTERIWRRQGTCITPDKQKGFNRMVMKQLDELFLLFTEQRLLQKNQLGNHRILTQKQVFLDFREKFGLTEDNLPLKTMEKKYERSRLALTA